MEPLSLSSLILRAILSIFIFIPLWLQLWRQSLKVCKTLCRHLKFPFGTLAFVPEAHAIANHAGEAIRPWRPAEKSRLNMSWPFFKLILCKVWQNGSNVRYSTVGAKKPGDSTFERRQPDCCASLHVLRSRRTTGEALPDMRKRPCLFYDSIKISFQTWLYCPV